MDAHALVFRTSCPPLGGTFHWLQRLESNQRTPVSETGVCYGTNYTALLAPLAGYDPAASGIEDRRSLRLS